MLNDNLIAPQYYYGESAKKLEFEKIFSKVWLFAAMESDLPENNHFITLDIYNYPIVIQNFRGQLKAFENICPHRFNKIQTDVKGKGMFICKYHNWSFDSAGKPKTIPQRDAFDVESEAFKCLQVKPLQIEQVGKFVFVSLNNDIVPLKEYLGAFYDKLLEVSNALDYNFYFGDDVQNINWKIIVENVIEAYHCPAIHQETLYGMGFCRKPERDNEYDEGHSVADYPKMDDAPAENKVLKYLDQRIFQHDTFRHFFVFPNLLISSTEGTSIYVGNIIPLSAEQSILRKRFYSPKFAPDFVPKESIHKAFLKMVESSINQILAEDKLVLEQVQKNMPFSSSTYFLGREEKRINHFHKKYLELIG